MRLPQSHSEKAGLGMKGLIAVAGLCGLVFSRVARLLGDRSGRDGA